MKDKRIEVQVDGLGNVDMLGIVRRSLLNARKIDEAKTFDKEGNGKSIEDIVVLAKKYVRFNIVRPEEVVQVVQEDEMVVQSNGVSDDKPQKPEKSKKKSRQSKQNKKVQAP